MKHALSGRPVMSAPARHVLNVAILRHEEATGERLPLDGWEHYYTGLGDSGESVFAYDRAPEDGHGSLRVVTDESGHHIDWEQSRAPEVR